MGRTGDSREKAFTGINVTPLTDVMLVLLITFLLTASSFESDTLSVPLPQLVETQEIEKHAVVLQVDREGRAVWPEGEFEGRLEQGLERLLSANRDKATLAIAVHRDCPYRLFYPVAAAATRVGWSRVLLLTEEKTDEG